MIPHDYIGKAVYHPAHGQGTVIDSSKGLLITSRTYYIFFRSVEKEYGTSLNLHCSLHQTMEMYNHYERLDEFQKLVLGVE